MAEYLAYGNYKSVNVPDVLDEYVQDYQRMRKDHKEALNRLKQQINAFCARLGVLYTEGRTKWTRSHMACYGN